MWCDEKLCDRVQEQRVKAEIEKYKKKKGRYW